jgi:hypothetical protein
MGQGHSSSPCPYKYRPSARRNGRGKGKKEEKREKTAEKGGKLRERNRLGRERND